MELALPRGTERGIHSASMDCLGLLKARVAGRNDRRRSGMNSALRFNPPVVRVSSVGKLHFLVRLTKQRSPPEARRAMQTKKAKRSSQEFPETAADRIAAKGRRLASQLNDEEHDECLRRALVIAYGGETKEAVRAGR